MIEHIGFLFARFQSIPTTAAYEIASPVFSKSLLLLVNSFCKNIQFWDFLIS